jgi:hypothetical protein
MEEILVSSLWSKLWALFSFSVVVPCSKNVIFSKRHEKDLFKKIKSLHMNLCVHFYVGFCEWNDSEFLIGNNWNRNNAQPIRRALIYFQRFFKFTAIIILDLDTNAMLTDTDESHFEHIIKCNTNADTYQFFPDLAVIFYLSSFLRGGGGIANSVFCSQCSWTVKYMSSSMFHFVMSHFL